MKFLHVAVLTPLLGIQPACLGPELTIATSIAQAALQTAIDYHEKNKPTIDELWSGEQVQMLERRAKRGDVEAYYELGRLYETYQDGAGAWRWTCLAANAGDARAQLQLGHWYNEDRNSEDVWPYIRVEPDNREALAWYLLAAAEGNNLAALFRDLLSRDKMNQDDVADARRRAAGGVPRRC